MTRARLAAACMAGVLLAPAAADADVHVEHAGDVVLVRGADGPDDVVVEVNGSGVKVQPRGGTLTVGPGCWTEAGYARCSTGGAQRVRVVMGAGNDVAFAGGANGVPYEVDAGTGDDTVIGYAETNDRIDGGEGRDRIDYGQRIGRVVATLGEGDSEDRLTNFEVLAGSRYDDVLSGGPGPDLVDGGQGDDRIDVRGGGADSVICGGEDGDLASVDASDTPSTCQTVAVEGGAPGHAPIVQPAPGRGVDASALFAGRRDSRRLGLIATPTAVPGAVVLVINAQGRPVTASMVAAPWAAPAAVEEVAAVRSGGGEDVVTLRMPLPPGASAALARDFRLRTRLTLRFGATRRSVHDRTGTITVIAQAPSPASNDGRVRRGGFGIQTFMGTAAGDLLTGQSANDVLSGLAGNDRLLGGTGDDRLEGGLGDDDLDGDDGSDLVLGGPGADHAVERRFGDDRLEGGDGDDRLFSGRGKDSIDGGPGDDIVAGGSGFDRVDCGPGEDVAFVNDERERRLLTDCEEIHLEQGVINRPCAIGGTDGSETLLGTDGPDLCIGLGGDDDLEGAAGDDALAGGPGNDRMFGRFGTDRMSGGEGSDELEGGRDEDVLTGGPGHDRLNGGFADDVVSGGPGDDRILARGGGADTVRCGPGTDTVFADSADRVARDCERVSRSGPRRARRT